MYKVIAINNNEYKWLRKRNLFGKHYSTTFNDAFALEFDSYESACEHINKYLREQYQSEYRLYVVEEIFDDKKQ